MVFLVFRRLLVSWRQGYYLKSAQKTRKTRKTIIFTILWRITDQKNQKNHCFLQHLYCLGCWLAGLLAGWLTDSLTGWLSPKKQKVFSWARRITLWILSLGVTVELRWWLLSPNQILINFYFNSNWKWKETSLRQPRAQSDWYELNSNCK